MAYTGLTAKLTVGGNTVAYISNWSVEETREAIEITKLGSMTKEIVPSLYSWTASAEGTADFDTDTSQTAIRQAMINGEFVEVKFYLSENKYMTGTALVNSFSVNISAEDKGGVSISLTGQGSLAMSST